MLYKRISPSCSSNECFGEEFYLTEDEDVFNQTLFDEFDDDDDDIFDSYSGGYNIGEYEETSSNDLKKLTNILENLECILPEIEQISEDITINPISTDVVRTHVAVDEGVFVDPLTGELLPTAVSEIKDSEFKDYPSLEEDEEEGEEEDVEESEESELISDSELTFSDDVEECIIEAQETVVETFATFLEMEPIRKVTIEEDLDLEKLAEEYEKKQQRQDILQFIEKVINQVVNSAEFVTTDTQLRQKMDKKLLIDSFKKTYIKMANAKQQKKFLEKKCVEYYKRKKSYRPIVQDNPKTLEEDKNKFYTTLNRLDECLQKEAGAGVKHAELSAILKQQLQDKKEESLASIAEFEAILRKALILDHRPNLNKIVDKLFTHMMRMREEINEVRFRLIVLEHIRIDILQQLSQFLSFSHVNVRELENMSMTLNHDLKKYRARCRGNIHTMAHYVEKQKMLADTVYEEQLVLEDLYNDRLTNRNRILQLKNERKTIRNSIKTFNFLNSLIDKPTLMIDYDDTMENVSLKQNVLNNLWNHKKLLEQEINKLNKKLSKG